MTDGKRTIFCKHYHGMQSPCDAGVDFETVKVNDDRFVYPCYNTEVKTCSLALYPTAQEIEQEDKELGEYFLKVQNARRLIVEVSHGKRNVDGAINCPACKDGVIRYFVAYNGHIHARCTTQGCLNWLE